MTPRDPRVNGSATRVARLHGSIRSASSRGGACLVCRRAKSLTASTPTLRTNAPSARHALCCTRFVPITSLELVAPRAVAPRQRRSRYVKGSSAGSVAAIASLAVCVGIGYISLVSAVLTGTSLVALCCAVTRLRWVQRALDWQSQHRACARRESKRQRALFRATAARQQQYIELRRLVEGIERFEPVEAQRLELQQLLDHFVELAVGHQRCMESLRIIGGRASQTTIPIDEKPSGKRRREIAARRLRHREEISTRLERVNDEIDAADDLIRLLAQRVAYASLDPLIDGENEIERRLAELDEVEAALVQVSA